MTRSRPSRRVPDAGYAVPGAWATHAACRGVTHAMALPSNIRGDRSSGWLTVADLEHIDRARAICRGCPVQADCLAWALTVPDPVVAMVAGGLTPTERQRVRDGDTSPLRRPGRQPKRNEAAS